MSESELQRRFAKRLREEELEEPLDWRTLSEVALAGVLEETRKDFPYSGCRLRNSELSDDGTCSNESCEHYRSCKWFLKNFGDGKK